MKTQFLVGVLLVLVVAVSALPTTAATASADEVGAPVINKQIVWGETSNGLQLGLRFDIPNHVYRRGETAQFDLIARNVGKKAVNFKYYSPLFPVAFVTDKNGKPVTNFLKSPPPLGFPVGLKTLALAPGAQTIIAQTELRIGSPIVPTLFWALDAPPGQYRVSFVVQLDAPFEKKNKRAPILLQSGFTFIGIAE